MSSGSFSSSGGSSADDLSASAAASADAVLNFFKRIYLEIVDDGLAQGKGTDEANNEWVVTVKGDSESVKNFIAQKDGAPIEYEMTYGEINHEEDESSEDSEEVSTLEEEIADSEQQLDIEFALSLNQETAYSYDSLSFRIHIDPFVAIGKYDRYKISIDAPSGARWEGFSIRYKFEGMVKFVPTGTALQNRALPAHSAFQGALVATSNPTGVFEFIAKGMAPPKSYYVFDPTGSIDLLDVVLTGDEIEA